MKKKCLIVGAGEVYDEAISYFDFPLIIAADGGYLSLKKRGVTPSLLVGDLDSLEYRPTGIELLSYKVEKDETDTELAYLAALERGASEFHIIGGVGGRSDHTFANYCLLNRIKNEGYDAFLYGIDDISFIAKNEKITLSGECGRRFSLFAFGGDARVNISGAKYSVSDVTLRPTDTFGVSNELTESDTDLGITSGSLLVIIENSVNIHLTKLD